jgi:two-component system LytT family response regulator
MADSNLPDGNEAAKTPLGDRWADQGQELRFNTSEGIHRTTVGEVVQLTSHGSYTNVQLICGQSIHVSKNLGQHEQKLTPFAFYRVHEKHLVNMAHITRFERVKSAGKLHLRNGDTATVARQRKKEFLEAFNRGAITL